MKTLVFIGGSADGQRRDVPDSRPSINILIHHKPSSPPKESDIMGHEEVYTRTRFSDADGQRSEAMVADSFKGSVMQTLIDNYRRNPLPQPTFRRAVTADEARALSTQFSGIKSQVVQELLKKAEQQIAAASRAGRRSTMVTVVGCSDSDLRLVIGELNRNGYTVYYRPLFVGVFCVCLPAHLEVSW